MSITGNLRTLELAELLQWLSQGQKTGALVVQRGKKEKRIYFRSGRIVASESNLPDEQLGSLLVREGLIDEPTLERAIKLQDSTQILLGKVLVTLGSISESELQRILTYKTAESIYELFTWQDGEFHFVPDEAPRQPSLASEIDVTNVVLEGMRRLDEARRDGVVPADSSTADGSRSESGGASAPNEPSNVVDLSGSTTIVDSGSSTDVRGYYNGALPTRNKLAIIVGMSAAAALIVLGSVWAFMRADSPSGLAEPERSARKTLPSRAVEIPVFESIERTLEDEQAEPITEAQIEMRADAVPAPPPDASDELRREYEAKLARLRSQLAEAELAAAEKDAAMTALKRAADSAVSIDDRAEAQLADISSPAELFRKAIAVDPEPTAGGDEPPSLAGSIPTTAAVQSASDEFRESLAPAGSVAIPTTEGSVPSPAPTLGSTAESKPELIPPVLLTKPNPRYPSGAMRLGREAEVTVRLQIDTSGQVKSVERVGPQAGMGFDQAALSAAKQTRWQPASQGGIAVESWAELRIQFRR